MNSILIDIATVARFWSIDFLILDTDAAHHSSRYLSGIDICLKKNVATFPVLMSSVSKQMIFLDKIIVNAIQNTRNEGQIQLNLMFQK